MLELAVYGEPLIELFRLMADMFPGKLLTAGMRLSLGLSVGGRGAGPGFMNCSDEYILEFVQSY